MIPENVVYNTDVNVGILQVPKTASTVFRVLKDRKANWKESQANKLDYSMPIAVVLRDPASRFLSSVNMHFQVEGNLFQHPMNFQNYLERDQHFVNQVRFLGDMIGRHESIDYWYYSKTVVQEMSDHYHLDIDSTLRSNQSTSILTSVNPDFITEHYKDDIDFIKSATFMNIGENYDFGF